MGKGQEEEEEEEEVVVVEEGNHCTVCKDGVEDEEEGNRGPPKNYSTDSYIISTSTYLPPPLFYHGVRW